jgi:hypothetical protein
MSGAGIHRRDQISRLALAIATLAIVTPGMVPQAIGDSFAPVSAVLPSGRVAMAAVWTGQEAIAFGGSPSPAYNQIVRYNPSTATVSVSSTPLPVGMYSASAVWAGAYAYILGGHDPYHSSCYYSCKSILRYDPAADSILEMGAKLEPHGRAYGSAVWTGAYAFFFGGDDYCDAPCSAGIVRYSPSTDTLTTMAASPLLLANLSWTSAVWTGQYAFIFGGDAPATWPSSSRRDHILRYNPASDTVTKMGAVLPTPRSATSAFWDGRYAYVFGGSGCSRPYGPPTCDEVLRYDPVADTITLLGSYFPKPRTNAAAVWADTRGFILGGSTCAMAWCDEILEYDPAHRPTDPPIRPTALQATPGNNRVLLQWSASALDTGVPASTYRIYRSLSASGTWTAIGETAGLAWIDTSAANLASTLGPRYYYYVTAVSALGVESAPSGIASAVPPAVPSAPERFVAVRTGAQEATLAWSVPAYDADSVHHYRVFRGTVPESQILIGVVPWPNHVFADSTLDPNSTYYYSVRAANARGEASAPSPTSAALPSGARACSDGLDNDGDGLIDHPADSGCSDANDDSESPTPECDDGVSNDGDILVDWPADPDCESRYDETE